ALYWATPSRFRNVMLLVAGLVFYGYAHAWYLALIAWAISTTYLSTNAMRWWPRHKRLWLAVAVAANLGALLAFKYSGFFTTTFGVGAAPGVIAAAMPLGLSFYALQV